MMDWRDRIVEIKRMKVSEIAGHPLNPRKHPKQQADALRGMLNEVGKADVLRAYTDSAGKVKLWDGHLRQDLDPDQEWWVAITDLTEQEAALMLVAFDPIAVLAEQDVERLDALLRDVQTSDEALQVMLAQMAARAGLYGEIDPADEWKGMPEFQQEDLTGFQSIHVHFKTKEDVSSFADLIGQKLTDKTRSIWYPQAEITRYADKRYADES